MNKRGLILLIVLAAVVMIGVGRFDYEATLYLHENGLAGFSLLMKRSVFEGHKLGASDWGVFVQVGFLVGYLATFARSNEPKVRKLRAFLGFATATSLISSLCLVHMLKLLVGRARPHFVVDKSLPFTDWYEFGSQFVGNGFFNGSFPSGHTATIIGMLPLAYGLYTLRDKNRAFGWAAWLTGAVIVALAILMALARAMALDHWLSDCMGSIFMVWIMTHCLYFFGLDVPAQLQGVERRELVPPRGWELAFVAWFCLAFLGGALTVLGLRAIITPGALAFAPAILLGFVVFRFCGRKLVALRARILSE